jgi:hypothetical protein
MKQPSFVTHAVLARNGAAWAVPLALTALMACNGGGGGNGTGGAGGGAVCGAGGASGETGPASLHGACALSTRVGQFGLSLLAMNGTSPPYTQFSGAVYDAVDPGTVWIPKMTVGSCTVLSGPTFRCTTRCVSPQICVAQDTCGPSRSVQDAGTITLTGLGCPRTEKLVGSSGYFDGLSGVAYPPAAAGAPIAFAATGGAAAPFTLRGAGIEPLQFDGSGLTLIGGQDLVVTWTPPANAGGSQTIKITINAAHHGGTAARLECTGLPDTGSTTVDGALIGYLISQGVAGFPTIDVSRQTVDSTTVASGCVDFTVDSTVSSPLAVCQSVGGACVKSCNCGYAGMPCSGESADVVCAAGTTCQADLTCK